VSASCTHTSEWGSDLYVTGPSGTTYKGTFIQSFQTDTAASSQFSNEFFSGESGRIDFMNTLGPADEVITHYSPSDVLVASNGSSLTMNLVQVVRGTKLASGTYRCEVEGQLIPSS
jgi:hypothetical protein